MTEISLPWNGSVLGDHGPYSDLQWAGAWRRFFTLDPATEGILPAAGDSLAVTNPSGRLLRTAPGAALVDGTFFQSTTDVDHTLALPSPATSRWDRIILRKSAASQTVRIAVLSGVEAALPSLPTLTQISGETWEIPLAKALINAAGVVTLTDERCACRYATALVMRRQGGDPSAWSTPGANVYAPHKAGFQAGATSISLTSAASGQVSVTFPSAFSAAPVVIVSSGSSNYLASVVSVTAQGVTLEIRHRDNTSATITVTLTWLAAGPL